MVDTLTNFFLGKNCETMKTVPSTYMIASCIYLFQFRLQGHKILSFSEEYKLSCLLYILQGDSFMSLKDRLGIVENALVPEALRQLRYS